MRVGELLLVFMVPLSTTLFDERIPPGIVLGLESDQFIDHEIAQKALLDWGRSGEVARICAIRALSKPFEEPELSHRTFTVLSELSELNYLAERGCGFVGISMNGVQFLAMGKRMTAGYFLPM